MVTEEITGDSRQRQINSTLMITGSILRPRSLYSIQCIIHQVLPLEYNLQGNNLMFFAGLAVLKIDTPGEQGYYCIYVLLSQQTLIGVGEALIKSPK